MYIPLLSVLLQLKKNIDIVRKKAKTEWNATTTRKHFGSSEEEEELHFHHEKVKSSQKLV
jgi:hypothetical protein